MPSLRVQGPWVSGIGDRRLGRKTPLKRYLIRVAGALRLRLQLDRVLVCEGGVLVGLLAEFEGRPVIALLVRHRRGGMGVCGQVVELGGAVVKTLRHRVSPLQAVGCVERVSSG